MSFGAAVIKAAAEVAFETAVGIIKRMVPVGDRPAAFSEFDRLWFRAKKQAELDARKARRS